MNSRSRVSLRLALIGLLGMIGYLHLHFLFAPPIKDESFHYFIARYGYLPTWNAILPAPNRNAADIFQVYTLWPAYLSLQRISLHILGDGLIAMRLPALLAQGLFCAGLILFVIDTPQGLWASGGLIAYSLTAFFCRDAHLARMDPFVLATLIAQLFFLSAPLKNRYASLGCGFIATFACCFHSIAAFLLPTYIVLLWLKRHPSEALDPLGWWIAGAMGGGVLALCWINWDAGLLSYAIHHHTIFFTPMPLQQLGPNPVELLRYFVSYTAEGLITNPWGDALLAVGLTLSFHFIRHARSRFPERLSLIGLLIGGIGLTMLLFNPLISEIFYNAYLYPWFWIASAVTVGSLWSGLTQIDKTDVLVFCTLLVASPIRRFVPLSTFAALSVIVSCMFLTGRNKLKTAFYIGLGLILIGLASPDLVITLGYGVRYHLHDRPGALLAFIFIPAGAVWLTRDSFKSRTAMRGVALAIMTLTFIFLAKDIQTLHRYITWARPSPETERLRLAVRENKRILAPDIFWLLRPASDFASTDALYDSEVVGGMRLPIKKLILAYHPQRLFWPKEYRSTLLQAGIPLKKRGAWTYQHQEIEEYELAGS